MFNYFTIDEMNKFTFFRIPKQLMTEDRFKELASG